MLEAENGGGFGPWKRSLDLALLAITHALNLLSFVSRPNYIAVFNLIDLVDQGGVAAHMMILRACFLRELEYRVLNTAFDILLLGPRTD